MRLESNSFSIVTPNYNMGHHLVETIESVLVNLRPDDEYFVIDGGSTDGSVEVIRRYALHLTGWISEPDKGYADALVKGFSRCSGTFLCWINSGDLLLRGALDTARQALTETGADLIFGDDLYIDDRGTVLCHSRGQVRSLKRMMLFGGWTPLQDACFWRRALYEKVGGINPNLRYAADYDFFLRASWAGRAVYVPAVFSAFRRHEGQKSISGRSAYEAEREASRRHMLDELEVPPVRRVATEAYYWLLVRWRHHITRRLHRAAPANQVSVETVASR